MTYEPAVLDCWLVEIHAMEQESERLLARRAEQLDQLAMLKSQIERQIAETRVQRDRRARCMARRGVTPAGDAMHLAEPLQKMLREAGGLFAATPNVSTTIAIYLLKQMEITAYRLVSEAARRAVYWLGQMTS